jgi:hypothetical protein
MPLTIQLCPPDRIPIRGSRSPASLTAARTSSASVARAMTSGYRDARRAFEMASVRQFS